MSEPTTLAAAAAGCQPARRPGGGAGLGGVIATHRDTPAPAVVGARLGGYHSDSRTLAVEKGLRHGSGVQVTAGRPGGWACDYSPGSAVNGYITAVRLTTVASRRMYAVSRAKGANPAVTTKGMTTRRTGRETSSGSGAV